MLVRRGRPDDLEALAALDEQAGAGSERRIAIDRFLSGEGGWCLVAEQASRPVGYVAVTPGRFFGRDFVELLVVARSQRRRGVGRHLMRAVAAEVTAPAGEALFTSTNASNEPMLALLRSEGWTVSGTLEGLDEDDPEIVLYRR
jgi:ribosomal protein S18 acetylase RimI-like enzyme